MRPASAGVPTATPGSGASGAVAANSVASAVALSVVGVVVVAAAAGSAGTAAGVPATAHPLTSASRVTQIGIIIPSVALNVLVAAS